MNMFRKSILAFLLTIFIIFSSQTLEAGVSDKPIFSHLNKEEIAKFQNVPYSGRFAFVVMGDNRDGDPIFEFQLALANKLDPLFIIDVGDIVSHGLKEEYSFFLQELKESKAPFLTVLGNHELSVPEGKELYKEIFGEYDYYFDYGGCRFIILNNVLLPEGGYGLSNKQLSWLEDLLKTDLVKFVFMHVPPPFQKWKHDSFERGSKEFIGIVEKYKVNRVFVGHIHAYDRLKRGNTEYIISGGAGAPLNPYEFEGKKRGYNLLSGPYYHFLYVIVQGDQVIDVLIKPNIRALPYPIDSLKRGG